MSFNETLLAHLGAKTPVMIVPTAEPMRALNDIISVCRGAKNAEGAFLAGNVKRWTISDGLVPVLSTLNAASRKDDGNKDPITALENVLSEDINISHMYVMVNYHHYISSPIAQQLLLDAVDRLPLLAAAVSKRIILLMPPGAAIPPALDRQVMRLQYGLPEATDLLKPLEVAVSDRRRRGRPVSCADADHLRRVAEGGVGLSLTEFENVIVRSLAQHGGFDIKQISDEKAEIVRKSGLLEFIEVTKTLDDIGGLEHMKQWLLERSRCFSDAATAYGLPPPKGVMMVGVSGGGKSLSAEACASVFGVPLIRLDMGKVFGSLVGQSEGNIQTIIQTLGAVAPVVLWIDEMEKSMGGMKGGGAGDSGTASRVLATFLTWLSEKKKPVFVVATTNDISTMPPELLRKGRLDEIFFVDLPTYSARREIAKIHIAKTKRDVGNYNLEAVAEASAGHSGAEIEQAVYSAMYAAFAEHREYTTADIVTALGSTQPLSVTMADQFEAQRAQSKGRARPASKPDVTETVAASRYTD